MFVTTTAAADRIERAGDTPRSRSENVALTHLDASRSSTELELALGDLAGGLTVREAGALDKLLRKALDDAYQAGWAAGHQAGRANPATDPFLV